MTPSQIWVNGVIGGFIAASAHTVTDLIVAPETFNVYTAGGLKKILAAVVVSGVVGSALYLKSHPTPWNGEERRKQNLPGDPAT